VLRAVPRRPAVLANAKPVASYRRCDPAQGSVDLAEIVDADDLPARRFHRLEPILYDLRHPIRPSYDNRPVTHGPSHQSTILHAGGLSGKHVVVDNVEIALPA